MITTQAGASVVVGGGQKLTDQATLSGGLSPTGSITFTLYNTSNNSVVDTETVNNITGDGIYNTPTGYLPTATGTYQWVATYSGDNFNLSATDNSGAAELETVTSADPTINTSQQPANATVGTSIADQATVSGYNPTGTVTFNLYSNSTGTGTPLFTDANEPLVWRRGHLGWLHRHGHGHRLLGRHLQRRQQQQRGHQRHRRWSR